MASPSHSPSKPSTQHCWLALKAPHPKKTGNAAIDTTNEAERELFMVMIDHCMSDSSHSMPLHITLMNRLSSADLEVGSNLFEKFSTVYSMDETWQAHFIVCESDFTS